jgi:hypothetical protein
MKPLGALTPTLHMEMEQRLDSLAASPLALGAERCGNCAAHRPQTADGIGSLRNCGARWHNKTLMQPAVSSAGKPASVTSRLLHS